MMKRPIHYLLLNVVLAMLLLSPLGIVQAGPCELPVFNVGNFATQANNPYLPIPADIKTYVYEAEDEDGLIRNYIQFTTDTKVILGVICTVVYDVEWIWVEELSQWFKLEETYDWHAWDQFGNFWYFGEDTVAYEYDDDWNQIGSNTEGSWEAGVDGAEPGIIIPGAPMPGDCYQQEYYEDEAEDVGKVLRLNAKASVAYNDYEDCLVMKEWTPLEPGNVEHKYYALNEGLVYIKELKEKTVEVELVDINADAIPDPPAPLP